MLFYSWLVWVKHAKRTRFAFKEHFFKYNESGCLFFSVTSNSICVFVSLRYILLWSELDLDFYIYELLLVRKSKILKMKPHTCMDEQYDRKERNVNLILKIQ